MDFFCRIPPALPDKIAESSPLFAFFAVLFASLFNSKADIVPIIVLVLNALAVRSKLVALVKSPAVDFVLANPVRRDFFEKIKALRESSPVELAAISHGEISARRSGNAVAPVTENTVKDYEKIALVAGFDKSAESLVASEMRVNAEKILCVVASGIKTTVKARAVV